jgi:hypothetical protein
MAERSSGAPGVPQVEYVLCELPKLQGRKAANALERWIALFVDAPLLDAATVASEPFSDAQRMALELANEATFSETELDAYRKARDEVQQMIQYGKDGEAKGEARGEARGRLQHAREALLRYIARRGFVLTEHDRARIDACRDSVTLDQWLDRALDATTLDELFAWYRSA